MRLLLSTPVEKARADDLATNSIANREDDLDRMWRRGWMVIAVAALLMATNIVKLRDECEVYVCARREQYLRILRAIRAPHIMGH